VLASEASNSVTTATPNPATAAARPARSSR
jgi:hypothetical protein